MLSIAPAALDRPDSHEPSWTLPAEQSVSAADTTTATVPEKADAPASVALPVRHHEFAVAPIWSADFTGQAIAPVLSVPINTPPDTVAADSYQEASASETSSATQIPRERLLGLAPAWSPLASALVAWRSPVDLTTNAATTTDASAADTTTASRPLGWGKLQLGLGNSSPVELRQGLPPLRTPPAFEREPLAGDTPQWGLFAARFVSNLPSEFPPGGVDGALHGDLAEHHDTMGFHHLATLGTETDAQDASVQRTGRFVRPGELFGGVAISESTSAGDLPTGGSGNTGLTGVTPTPSAPARHQPTNSAALAAYVVGTSVSVTQVSAGPEEFIEPLLFRGAEATSGRSTAPSNWSAGALQGGFVRTVIDCSHELRDAYWTIRDAFATGHPRAGAALLALMPGNFEAVDEALDSLLGELDRAGDSLAGWLDELTSEASMTSGGLLAGAGLAAWYWARTRQRKADEQAEDELARGMFLRFQGSLG